jgi:hypothetical protein
MSILSAPELLRTRRLLVVSGVPIDDLTMEQALERIDAFIAFGRDGQRSHQIATVNADFVVKAAHDPELRYLLQQADMAKFGPGDPRKSSRPASRVPHRWPTTRDATVC